MRPGLSPSAGFFVFVDIFLYLSVSLGAFSIRPRLQGSYEKSRNRQEINVPIRSP